LIVGGGVGRRVLKREKMKERVDEQRGRRERAWGWRW